MNTRQNNKSGRLTRKRYIHRDRTVTTLTGNDDDQDPFSFTTGLNDEQQQLAYTAPTPLVAVASNVNQLAMLPSNFSFGFNSFAGPLNANNNPNNIQNDTSQQPYLPPGKNDLEILENLKERIKQGQHEFFRATPTPGALASIYLGPSTLPEQQVADARVQELENNGTVGAGEESSVKRASSSTPAASDSSSKNSVQESKENGRKNTTTTPDNMSNSSLPAKPAPASNGLNKDERPLGRETYPPPEPSTSSDINGNNGASKYYDSRDTRDSVRRGSSGAEYASIRYGPIRDDRRIPPDTRRPEAPYEASHLPRREDYPPVDEYRRAAPPAPAPLPPPSDRDRYAHPPIDDRYSDRYERLPPAVPTPTPPTQPAASVYSAGFRPDDRERQRYDEHRRDGSHGHTAVSNRPLQVHSSRYNENRLQIGESPVAAAAAAERERQAALATAGLVTPANVVSRSRLPPPAPRPIPPVDDRDRERERDRDLRPAPPAKLEERISGIGGPSTRIPTLQERLSHPPLDAPSGPLLTRALSLEERLHPPPSGSVTANGTVPTSPPSKASANPSNAPSGPEISSAPPTSASASTASTTGSISVSDDPRGRPTPGGPSVAASAPSNSIPAPGPRGYSRPPSVVQDASTTSRPAYDDRERGRRDSHAIDVDPPAPYPAYNSGPAPPSRPRYSSPSPSDRDRDRHRTYPSPPLQPPAVYDGRDRNREIRESELRERDHHRATSGGAPPSSVSGRDYVYNDTRDRDQRRDWPENDYYRSSSSTSRPPPSVYPPSAAPLPPGDRDPRDPRSGVPLATSMASSRSAAWEARGDRDHERRTSASSAITATPPRGVPGISNPPSSVVDDRDRSYRPDPRYAPPPSSAPISGTPPTYNRVRPRSPSPHRINDRDRDRPLAKRARDDLYPPPASSYPQPAYTNSAPPPRRPGDYPPPPPQAVRDPRDTYYDHRDSRPPLPPPHTQHAGHAEYGRPPPPAGYDRARSPPRTSAPTNYAYRGDPREMREVRDIRDPRDLRDPRDIRESRDMRELRDPRDDRRYSMPPPPLPR
ncbi:hypothetical protein BDP27DRAFT_1366801 [Rhodocollybia butyracea]|uniref:Uncharacterized protein n=1 Tax=Rhodocollybia butyracea TaxID=206335 RepID=A0A9P5PM12_9AGAR|nr:hypothetical protein BDP27DRAFT_1366801 [Rhodocollybia butyracea]